MIDSHKLHCHGRCRGEVLQAAAAAVDQKAEDGRRRNAAEKEKCERLAADPVDPLFLLSEVPLYNQRKSGRSC